MLTVYSRRCPGYLMKDPRADLACENDDSYWCPLGYDLASSVAPVSDGRFSGAIRGPAVGCVSPESWKGTPRFAQEETLFPLHSKPHHQWRSYG